MNTFDIVVQLEPTMAKNIVKIIILSYFAQFIFPKLCKTMYDDELAFLSQIQTPEYYWDEARPLYRKILSFQRKIEFVKILREYFTNTNAELQKAWNNTEYRAYKAGVTYQIPWQTRAAQARCGTARCRSQSAARCKQRQRKSKAMLIWKLHYTWMAVEATIDVRVGWKLHYTWVWMVVTVTSFWRSDKQSILLRIWLI